MAIDSETARFLVAASKSGVSFSKMLMLGRQNYLLRPNETKALFSSFGMVPDSNLLKQSGDGNWPFSEPFFGCLGAQICDSMDVAGYEGATVLHDLNDPINQNLAEKYDVVFDGGTLEHVFNFPTGLHNAMQMVKRGGWYLGFTPGNNYFGHGFYQFSPELYYRTLSPENGFSSCAVFIVPEGFGLNWYYIGDPARLGKRTNLINKLRTPLLVIAKKAETTPAKLHIQQSDYNAFWNKSEGVLNTGKTRTESSLGRRIKEKLYELAPVFTRRLATFDARSWHPEYALSRKEFFVPVPDGKLSEFIIRQTNLPVVSK